ncbi:MAG: DUF5018 domain-containing protein, partial [Tannerellaceae bacterium]|nr:DUF5018 domain-containing protein [Tannerellaceae bacterium]
MKLSYITLFFLFLVACAGCIQDEPLSPYADITAFSLPENVRLSNATINQTNISVMVRKTADLSAIVPVIEISEGATIYPEIGTSQDFSKNVQYTVTAADGKHQRTFTVQAISIPVYSYDFENWEAL